jgi:thiamine biosynthesis protein ThiI
MFGRVTASIKKIYEKIESESYMEFKAFLIKYAEIGIKGKNRYMFEDALMRQMKFALKEVGDFAVHKQLGRVFAEAKGDFDFEEAVDALKSVFGITGICPVIIEENKEFDHLAKVCCQFMDEQYPDKNKTFKVYGRRADKRYPMNSMEFSAEMGSRILDAFPEFKVDVRKPDILLTVEIRDKVYIYSDIIKGPGGMPVGTNGKAMLCLSGGIDSPVAGYMIAKRGVRIDATYFHAPPYTSERAKQKVVDLAKKVARYSGPINLHVVNFTDIQLAIYEKCPHDELTIIMRRYMMKIAEHFAKEGGSLALITGESIGQVASQTIHNLAITNEVCTLPVFRPCIGMDKQEIVDIAERIDTYETSIQPFEDCCTIFVAKHPVTKGNLKVIKHSEEKLNDVIDELMEKAIETVEVIHVEA